METTQCPFCREEIKAGAIKCKHCGSMIVDISRGGSAKKKEEGSLWLPVPSLILGILCLLALLDDSYWDAETIAGFFVLAVTGFVLGIVSVSVQKAGKGMAIAGVVLSSISLLAGLGQIAG